MARPTTTLILALRETASRLAESESYQWGHMGHCNCGHLAQTITGLTPSEIHASALERFGDWEEQANRYCAASGLVIDHVLAAMLSLGFDRNDIRNLEKLCDPAVVRRAGRHLRHNLRDDVVLYMRLWADLLEARQSTGDMQAEVMDQAIHSLDEVGAFHGRPGGLR
jgi:hypothetical protein